MSEAVSELLEQQESTVKEVVAQSASTVWGGLINRISEARIHETSMGNLICDSMIDAVKGTLSKEYSALPVVAAENGGGIVENVYCKTNAQGQDYIEFRRNYRF